MTSAGGSPGRADPGCTVHVFRAVSRARRGNVASWRKARCRGSPGVPISSPTSSRSRRAGSTIGHGSSRAIARAGFPGCPTSTRRAPPASLRARLTAALLRLGLGEATATGSLIDVLEAPDCGTELWDHAAFGLYSLSRPRASSLAIDGEALTGFLDGHLTPDDPFLGFAGKIANALELPGRIERFEELASTPGEHDRGWYLWQLAEVDLKPSYLDLAEELWQEGGGETKYTLGLFARSNDPGLRDRAVGLLCEQARSMGVPRRPRRQDMAVTYGSELGSLVGRLRGVEHPSVFQLVREMAFSDVLLEPYRGEMLRQLVQTFGRDTLEDVRAAVRVEGMRDWTLLPFAELVAAHPDPELFDELRALLEEKPVREDRLEEIRVALRPCRAPGAREILEAIAPAERPHEAMVRQHAEDPVTLERFVEALREAGLGDALTPEALAGIEATSADGVDVQDALFRLLHEAGRFEIVGVNSYVHPIEYDHVVASLAEASHGAIVVTDAVQHVATDAEGRATYHDVSLAVRGRGEPYEYRFHNPDFFELGEILDWLNDILGDLGSSDRFEQLYLEAGEHVAIACVPPGALEHLRRTLGFPLASELDPHHAIKI